MPLIDSLAAQPAAVRLMPSMAMSFLCFWVLGSPALLAQANWEKEKEIRQVYQSLTRNIGEDDLNWPKLEFTYQRMGLAASYSSPRDNQSAQILLEWQTIEALGASWRSGVAFVLSHELGHFINDRDRSSVGGPQARIQGRRFMGSAAYFYSRLDEERRADVFGAINAELAGFSVMDSLEDIFDKLYQAFEWPSKVDGYPPLSERKATARRAQQKAQRWVAMYEMGLYLMAIHEYEQAWSISTYLIRSYRSTEVIYQNGLAYLLHVIEQVPELGYAFPIQQEWENRLRGLERQAGYLVSQEAQEHLAMAQKRFTEALALQHDYLPAQLGLGIIALLERDWVSLERRLSVIQRQAQSDEELALYWVLRGIMAAERDQAAGAEAYWKNALRQAGASTAIRKMVDHNRTYLRTGRLPRLPAPPRCPSFKGIQIQSQTFTVTPKRLKLQKEGSVPFEYRDGEGKYRVQLQMLLGQTGNPGAYTLLGRTQDEEVARAIGRLRRDIIRQLPRQKYEILPTTRGYLMVYPNCELVLRFDRHDRLQEWAEYRVRE